MGDTTRAGTASTAIQRITDSMPDTNVTLLSFLVLVVAGLYSSVGHGGASGYLAVLSLFGFAPNVMATTALVLNVLVAGLSTTAYFRAGHFSWRILWPFLLGSVPAAFVGGSLKLPPGLYYLLLALTLILVAMRLFFHKQKLAGSAEPTADGGESKTKFELRTPTGIVCGAVLGLLSGMVGIGGGVFLTPLLLLMGWAPPKTASGISAMFIVINSIAGLIGRSSTNQLAADIQIPLILAALVGGTIGSHIGANVLSDRALRQVLAVVLLTAAAKLIMVCGIFAGH